MNQAEASRRIERLEEDVAKIEAELVKIAQLLVRLNAILHGERDPATSELKEPLRLAPRGARLTPHRSEGIESTADK